MSGNYGYSADDYGYGSNYGYGSGAFGAYGAASEVASPLDAEIQVVLREIHSELNSLEHSGEYGDQFKNARRLLTSEANKLENNIDPEWLEVDINKAIKVTKKILIPSFRHPKFNFVGKVLGPKGTTLQNIAKQYKCHVYILGRGSTRDRSKEQELLASGDPQFAHYGGPLHVKVETTAPPAVAYQRVSGVIHVLSELLIPVKDTHIEGITTVSEHLDKSESGGQQSAEAQNNTDPERVGSGDQKQENGDDEAVPSAGSGTGGATGAGPGTIKPVIHQKQFNAGGAGRGVGFGAGGPRAPFGAFGRGGGGMRGGGPGRGGSSLTGSGGPMRGGFQGNRGMRGVGGARGGRGGPRPGFRPY